MNPTGRNPQASAVAIIPARFNSTRLPGKPLLDICGRPMVVRVCERASAARNVSRVLVATDDGRILDAVRSAGFEAVMTRADHPTGTDRLAEAAAGLGAEFGIVVNVQGDEPLISPRTIERAVETLAGDPAAQIATTCEPIADAEDVLSPDVVKVVADEEGRALYFSRSPVPFPREAARRHGSLGAALAAEPALLAHFRKHTGLYVYRRDFLARYAALPPGALEVAEQLEQLRALASGARIRVVETDEPSLGVDNADDLTRARAIFKMANG